MDRPEGISEANRDLILDAALEELVKRGIDKFTVDGVARRAGVEPAVIDGQWRDRRVLLMDALITRAKEANPCPDTGSLSDDLAALAATLVQLNESKTARQLTHRMLPGRDLDMSEIGRDLLEVRFQSLTPIFHRAAERGEVRAGLSPDDLTRMFCAACLRSPVFRDEPVPPQYAEQLRDAFLYGVLTPETRERALAQELWDREQMRALLRATYDAMIDPLVLVQAVRDLDGRITDFTFLEVNPATSADLQTAREELIGVGMVEKLPDIEPSGLFARYVRCLETGEPLLVDDFTLFSPRHRETRRYDVRAAPAGADRLSLTWRDVTERHGY